MKIIKWTMGIMSALVIAFFSIGVFNPSFNYHCNTIINASAETTWNIFSDPDQMSNWFTDFKSMTITKGLSGAVGSEYDLVFIISGEEMLMHKIITSVESNKSMTFEIMNDDIRTVTTVSLAEKDGITTLLAENSVNPKGMVNKSVFYVFKSYFQKQSDDQYAKLKSLIEDENK